MRKHYEMILTQSDKRVKRMLSIQEMNPENAEGYGGFRDSTGLIQPKFSIYRLTTMAACWFNRGSVYYQDEMIRERLRLAVDYVARGQRENGCFDLIDCNFYSAPDTAFCVKRLLLLYSYTKKIIDGTVAAEEEAAAFAKELNARLREIIYRGGKGMAAGGFHTPNHRHAIASNLLECYRIFGEEAFLAQAEKYLAEGIDCNEDGEFAERSAGNYNRINNDAMLTIGEITGEEAYFRYAERNLNMMLTYIEPDGSIFTNNSTRQDRGRKLYPKDYYLEYLILGIRYQNPLFLQAANFIFDTVAAKGLRAPDFLLHMMNRPELIDVEEEKSFLPETYHKFYKDSEIVRVRNGGYSYTVLNKSSTFLYFQNGDFSMSLKIGASFCEHRAFCSETITKTDRGYHLEQTMRGWYYLPFGEAQGTTDWWKMENEKREKLYGPDLRFDVDIEEIKDGVSVHIKASGIDRAPLRLELAFDKGAVLETDGFFAEGNAGGFLIAKQGMLTAARGDYAIEAGPAFGAHNFTAGKFGSDSRSTECFTVYFTDITEFEHTVTLRAKDNAYA